MRISSYFWHEVMTLGKTEPSLKTEIKLKGLLLRRLIIGEQFPL